MIEPRVRGYLLMRSGSSGGRQRSSPKYTCQRDQLLDRRWPLRRAGFEGGWLK